MPRTKKTKDHIITDEFIELLAIRKNFAKKDVILILEGIKEIFQECIEKNIDIDLKGLIHMQVMEMNYKKAPGIVAHKGKTEFKSKTKRVVYKVPQNFRDIVKK